VSENGISKRGIAATTLKGLIAFATIKGAFDFLIFGDWDIIIDESGRINRNY
jgi:hypothetical protein